MTRVEIYTEESLLRQELEWLPFDSERRTQIENRLQELDDTLRNLPYKEGMFAGVVKELQRLGKLPQD